LETINFEKLKDEIDSLSAKAPLFTQLEDSVLYNPILYSGFPKNNFIESRILISNLSKKSLIFDRLQNLRMHISSLKEAIESNNLEKASERTNLILKNEFSSIKAIISEISAYESDIKEYERLNSSLVASDSLSLDIRMMIDRDLKRKKPLDDLVKQQKTMLLQLSRIFIKTAKSSISSKR
jgi:hypothetical protein